MTSFELLAYVTTFATLFLIVALVVLGIYVYAERKRFFDDFLKRKEKMEGNFSADSSSEEK